MNVGQDIRMWIPNIRCSTSAISLAKADPPPDDPSHLPLLQHVYIPILPEALIDMVSTSPIPCGDFPSGSQATGLSGDGRSKFIVAANIVLLAAEA